MANSYIEYNQNLSETTYDVPFNVLSIDDVNVKGYDGSAWSDLTVSERDAVAKTVTLSGAPSAYQKIRVWRNTGTTQLVDFQNGSRLSESDLDTAYQQGLFVAQEVSENASASGYPLTGAQGPAGADGADGADATTPIPDAGAIGAYSLGRPISLGAIAIGATSTDFYAWQQNEVANVMRIQYSSIQNASTSSQTGTWRCMSGCHGDTTTGYTGLWLRIS